MNKLSGLRSLKKTSEITLFFPYRVLLLLFCTAIIICCDVFQKQDLPPGHNKIEKNVYHGDHAYDPFDDDKEEGCSSTDCHQADLRGGIAEVKGVKRVAPSCYQCHGRLWEHGRGGHREDD